MDERPADPPPEPGGALMREQLQRASALRDVDLQDLVAELSARLDASDVVDKLHTADWLTRLSMLIDDRTNRFDNRLSAENLRGHMSWIVGHARWSPELLERTTFLDLGCGGLNPYARCLAAVAAGARRGVAVDLDPINDPFVAATAAARATEWLRSDPTAVFEIEGLTAADSLPRLAGIDVRRLKRGDLGGLDPDLVAFENRDCNELDQEDAEVGVSLSSAFLEHVPDLGRTIREIARVTKPGGIGVHNIDAADHRVYWREVEHPLEFLTVETDDALVAGSNRLRIHEIRELFEQNGFDVIRVHVHTQAEMNDDLRARLAARFRAMSDEELSATGAIYEIVRNG